MVLAIDIGNSTTTIALFGPDGKPAFRSDTATRRNTTRDQFAIVLKGIFDLYHADLTAIGGAVISSVVPSVTHAASASVELLTGKPPMMMSPGLKTGLNIKSDIHTQMGGDIVACSVAAIDKYPSPIIVIDMGTATTISAMDRDGKMLGGSILPGVRISLEALTSRTAQLPQIELSDPPRSIIGANTIDCMKSGVLYGTASMLDGMIDRYKAELGEDLTVIATGGLSKSIAALCRNDIVLDENLVLEGLRILFQKNTK